MILLLKIILLHGVFNCFFFFLQGEIHTVLIKTMVSKF